MHVFRRMAAWAWSIRWVLAVLAAVVALPVLYVLLWYGPDVLARHDVGNGVTGPLRVVILAYATDAARGQLLTLGAGIFAAGALTFTARNFTLSREGQLTERYTKAIEQLGSDKLDVRIGGIYALERIARDSSRDHPTVMEVLAAFVREHSREQWPIAEAGAGTPEADATTPEADATTPEAGAEVPKRWTRPDVQAAIDVIGRREVRNDRGKINLAGASLPYAKFIEANFAGADLRADLSGADLTGANLTGANLTGANLTGATLAGKHGPGGRYAHTNFTGARLVATRFTGTWPSEWYFAGADLYLATWPDKVRPPSGWVVRNGLLDPVRAKPREGS
jgi:hypothetical protein